MLLLAEANTGKATEYNPPLLPSINPHHQHPPGRAVFPEMPPSKLHDAPGKSRLCGRWRAGKESKTRPGAAEAAAPRAGAGRAALTGGESRPPLAARCPLPAPPLGKDTAPAASRSPGASRAPRRSPTTNGPGPGRARPPAPPPSRGERSGDGAALRAGVRNPSLNFPWGVYGLKIGAEAFELPVRKEISLWPE